MFIFISTHFNYKPSKKHNVGSKNIVYNIVYKNYEKTKFVEEKLVKANSTLLVYGMTMLRHHSNCFCMLNIVAGRRRLLDVCVQSALTDVLHDGMP